MRILAVLSLLLGALTAQAATETASDQAKALFKAAPCATSFEKMLKLWTVKGEWAGEPASDSNLKVFNSPTETVGVWVQARFHGDGPVELIRTSPEATSFLAWDGKCALTSRTEDRPLDAAAMKASFTDQKLADLIKAHPSGLIYVWSPRMTYSKVGIPRIEKVAKKLRLPLEIVLDPNANQDLAQQAAGELKLGPAALRPNQSMELLNRGALNHYPVLAVYSHGQITGVIPGLFTEEQYADEIKARLR